MKTIKYVKCTDAGANKNITNGKVYKVVNIKDNDYDVIDNKGNVHEYYKARFNDLTPIMTVECVDAKGLKNLTEGKKYIVFAILDDDYIVADNNGKLHEYYKFRFDTDVTETDDFDLDDYSDDPEYDDDLSDVDDDDEQYDTDDDDDFEIETMEIPYLDNPSYSTFEIKITGIATPSKLSKIIKKLKS